MHANQSEIHAHIPQCFVWRLTHEWLTITLRLPTTTLCEVISSFCLIFFVWAAAKQMWEVFSIQQVINFNYTVDLGLLAWYINIGFNSIVSKISE